MSWSELKATVNQVYQTNEDVLEIDASDNVVDPAYLAGVAVNEIYYEVAKNELKSDILASLELATDNVTELDIVATDYEYSLQIALRNKQLELLYRRVSEGEGSVTYDRWLNYQEAYEKSRMNFYKMDYLTDTKKSPNISIVNLSW